MKLFELYADLSLDMDNFNSNAKKASQMGGKLATSISGSIGGAAKFVGNQLSATTVMVGNLMADVVKQGASMVKQLGSVGIDYNRQMETYATNFTTMLGGSASEAERLTEDLESMAAATPFAMTDLADATQTLLAFGQDSSTVLDTLQSLGDIAMGDANKLNSLTLAFAQASSSGKLMGQDLLQMINAGFNPLQTIVDKTGASMGDLKDFMSDGKASSALKKQMKAAQKEVKKLGDQASDGAKILAQMGEDGAISAEVLGQIFSIETSPGGKFYNAMQNASKTFDGMISTLEDDSSALMGKVFEPMFDALTDDILPKAQNLIGTLDKAYDVGGVRAMASAATAILSTTLGEWAGIAYDAGANILAQVLTGMTGDTVNAQGIKEFVSELWGDGVEAVKTFVSTGSSVLGGIWNGISGDTTNKTNIVEEISGLWNDGKEAITDLTDSAGSLFGAIYEGLTGQQATADNIGEKIGGVFKAGATAANDVINTASTFFDTLSSALGSDQSAGKKIADVFVAGSDAMALLLNDAGSFLSNLYKEITSDTVGAVKLQNFFDLLFATSEEWKTRFASVNSALDVARENRQQEIKIVEQGEVIKMLGTLGSSGPRAHGIEESLYYDWSDIVMQGEQNPQYEETVRNIMDAYYEHQLYEGYSGDLQSLFGDEAIPAEGFEEWDAVKEDETSSSIDSLKNAIDILQNFVETLPEEVAEVVSGVLSGAKVDIDGKTVGQILLGYISSGLARNNRLAAKTSG